MRPLFSSSFADAKAKEQLLVVALEFFVAFGLVGADVASGGLNAVITT